MLLPPIAVIELTFSPIAQVGPWTVRLETIALAVIIFVSLLLAVVAARRSPSDAGHLRADDLLFIAVAAIPGAVLGGRLGYVLLHLDFYTAVPTAVLDLTQGGFELALAVVAGTLTAAVVAALLGAPVRGWLHAAAVPLLFALGAGKAAMLLGGDGQGLPWDGGWATAYLGPGPWGSLAPALPSHPAQAYEALSTAVVVLVVIALLRLGRFGRRSGALFLVAVALWAIGRAMVASTWRDPTVAGPLNMGQLLALAVAAGMLVLLVIDGAVVGRRSPRPSAGELPPAATSEAGVPAWADPSERPRI